ncbi:AaceriABL003Cp [[Ashbya] aceris (nom. inval.)]|nr:AaceriABL003Cp [[Ashbya] aceris (nom. inval.)]
MSQGTIFSQLKIRKKRPEAAFYESNSDTNDVEAGEHFITELDKGDKRLGLFSSIGLICNRMLGTGIFVVPAKIFQLTGSIYFALGLWVLGALIALAGLYVYMEFGTAIPRNGGEKNYLEFIFKKPKFFITSMYSAYVIFLGWAAGNSVMAAAMFLDAGNVEATRWRERGLGVAVVFFCFLINSFSVKAGLYFQNLLGVFKVATIIFIAITGLVALGGHINGAPGPENFRHSPSDLSPSAYTIVNALYQVIWSFVGYSNVNYALGEVKNPVRTLKIAGPTSLAVLSILYLLVNVAFFAVVPMETLKEAGMNLTPTFFSIAFGDKARRASAVFIGLSALGNVCSVIFSQGRIVQQLGREGVLPFTDFFASSKPFNSPMTGLFQHMIICAITILAPPPGDAYDFVLNLISYPMNIINFILACGLIWIYWQKRRSLLEWNPPIRAGYFVTLFFLVANLFLIVAPYVPPPAGFSVYKSLPYYIHCVVTWAIFAVGSIYWVIWSRLLPKWRNYELVHSEVLGEDGFWRNKIIKKYAGDDSVSAPDAGSDSTLKEGFSGLGVKQSIVQ